jgi:uncharacterized protein (DUF305 family)
MRALMNGTSAAAPASQHGTHSHGASPQHEERFTPTFERFRREMDSGMDTMMKDMHAPGYTGNVDVDFLAMMIPHHEGAVEMARLLLIHGDDPLTRKLAEEIIASQTAEIAAMKERLAILRVGEDPEPGGFPPLHGTRGGSSR